MNEFKITVTVQGITELVEAINRLAGVEKGPVAPVPPAAMPTGGMQPPMTNTMPAQAPAQAAPAMPQGQMPVQAAPAMPQGQMPVQAASAMPQGQIPVQNQPPAVPAIPTAAPAQGYTLEQLQVAAAGLMSAGKGPQVMGLMQRFGIQAMTELPKERYGEFAMTLREAGAQV